MHTIECRTCGRVSYGRMPSNYCNAKCRTRSPEYIESNRIRMERRRREQGRKKIKDRLVAFRTHRHQCGVCSVWFWSTHKKRVRCDGCRGVTSLAAAGLLIKSCITCGTSFQPSATHGRVAGFCSSQCRAERRRAIKRKCRRDTRRRHGNPGTHRKRARRASVDYEPVNVHKVMDRDGWRCQICGRPTPKKLRGTCKPNAPELDHIIPFAMGGPHTYSNVQCACRECNAAKGGVQVVGQMGLFGVAA